ncbi:MAG: hypothetical protein KIT31_10930 [Deltaproteobacteria bacterium]|nr:hypothetical protein [Deltaproteobacteria bacterium]
MRAAVALCLLGLVACGSDDAPPARADVAVAVDPAFAGAFTDFVAFAPGVTLGEGSPKISVVADAALPAEGYRLERTGDGVTVRAADVLGAQYGAAAALEGFGYRFRHPFDPFVPGELATPDDDAAVHAPQIRVRGMQLHTLHPIEGYFAFWEPDTGTEQAKRVIDWLVKNRGNFLQWVALDDILEAGRRAAWRTFTREILDYAKARGVRTGINIQLFGQSNLQLAFDLSDDRTGMVPIADEIAERLPMVIDGVPFDVYDLSFGEFFNADPQRFVDSVNEVRAQLRAALPAAEMHAVVHVGAEQRVEFMGSELLYYFLVKFADPSIVPDIHTTMFYNLFEPADGAYQHTEFDEHRAYLLERKCAGLPAAYFPETAYWVAFDNSVPQLFPLYVRNRWLDLDRLAAACPEPLDNHLLFSTGWEWSYWLHDTSSLRTSYELAARWEDLIAHQLAPDLGAAAPLVTQLVELQHRALQGDRLVAYLAGRDAAIDAGRQLNIISQPDRVRTIDLPAHPDWNGFRATVLAPLARYAQELDGMSAQLAALALPASRWAAELRDGFAVDALRAHFVGNLYEATLAHLGGADAAARQLLALARRQMAEARTVVARRHADLHDPNGARLIEKTPNRTFYQFGYLFMADTLCYWERELAEVDGLLGTATGAPPSCLF